MYLLLCVEIGKNGINMTMRAFGPGSSQGSWYPKWLSNLCGWDSDAETVAGQEK